MSLPAPEQFAEFFQTVYGYKPFPWQTRLAKRVCGGGWPRAIALPTAAGKTACIDIAVFALACHAKDAPRRIFFVVDRRIVVDQAWMHAKSLAKMLQQAESGILKDVADSLREVAQDERPLDVYALRGGMYRETAWTRSPLQPTVIASTVDQVGSRLLFRGYGVSDSMKPIHAGLVGNDALILLDEAHCARPFDQTMQAVEKYRDWTEGEKPPFRFVSMTATPTGNVPTERDEEDDRLHPILGKRIAASKAAMLVVAEKAKGKNGTAELVKVLENQARALSPDFACVGIIVNRVKTGRQLKAKFGAEAVLLTGRMRPLDRDKLFEERLKPLLSNAEGVPPKFVIGTQCLECGADFDFHGLVTECASLDALRQRFGRLNRVANRPAAKAVIVIRDDETEDTAEDPVYGASLANTWKWLKSKALGEVFDFGVSAVRTATDGVDLVPLNAPTEDAPVLFPAHLDCWAQTNPRPKPDPEPALFLHGPSKPGQPDVQVVFRRDLGADEKQWADIVALCPPSSSEAVPVPISVFKKWLAGEAIDDQSGDVEGEAYMPEDDNGGAIARFALCWEGPDKSAAISAPKDVRPNKVYVVPCSAPDVLALGDFPFGLTDYAEEAFQRSRDKAVLRLTESKLSRDADDFHDQLTEQIQAQLKEDSPEWLKQAVETLQNPKHREYDQHPLGGWVVTGKRRLHLFDPTYLDDSEPAESFRGREVKLVEHSEGVASHARRFAAGCRLDAELYYQAGLWHDLGKLDPRFQAMLKQSSPRTAVGAALAKSGRPPETKRDRDEARKVHCYPSGARHELLSAALVAKETDDDLLLHLIATHHGAARPFAGSVEENGEAKKPFKTELLGQAFELPTSAQQILAWNADLPERFWRVVRKLGWWGTAYHEAIFRLADHAQSRAEQEKQPDGKPADVNPAAFARAAGSRLMYPLPLTGLDGANPLAFLAAVGAFRLAHQAFDGKAKMSWNQSGCWQPVLHLPEGVDEGGLVEALYGIVHRTTDPAASNQAEQFYDAYRARLKLVEAAMKAIKERKLRGAERAAAIDAEVTPLGAVADSARRAWLEALDKAVPAPFLSLGKALSVTAKEYRVFAARVAERLHANGPAGRPDADFASAFGCEACLLKSGRIAPTEFQLVTGSGHQFFLETLGTLMETVTADQIKRAIFGPWTYSDPRLSFRWDPLDDRRYAYGWDDPSGVEVRTEHGANLLAAFALPMFPLIPTARAAATTGFDSRSDSRDFTWPIWSRALTVDVLRSLVAAAWLQQHPVKRTELRVQGVAEVFRTRKIEVGRPPLSKLNLTTAVSV